jgi:hypothetical protein
MAAHGYGQRLVKPRSLNPHPAKALTSQINEYSSMTPNCDTVYENLTITKLIVHWFYRIGHSCALTLKNVLEISRSTK